ncbi:MAG: hypothetical protein GXO60_03105 [Epsilonproteobacteria bacterium]|nr:hypothetical protein [Campylobacterota bacterium]
MKTDIKLIIMTFLFFSAIVYSKGTPPKPTDLSSKHEFLKVPNKNISKFKSIDLIKPVSIPPDGNIDFRDFFQF